MIKINEKIITNCFSFLIYAFLYIPILVVVVYSFNKSQFSMIWEGFSLKWYRELINDHEILTATWHSLLLGFLASTSAVLLGSLAAVCIKRYKFQGRKLLHGLVFTLVVIPDLVMGIALLILFHFLPVPLGFWSLFFAHTTFCLPFVIVTLHARLGQLDKHLFESAKDLGASEFVLFRQIILPLLGPALISSWLLSFTLSIDDVIISYFVAGPSFEILPLKIYAMVRTGVTPEVNAISTIILGFTLLFVVGATLIRRKK